MGKTSAQFEVERIVLLKSTFKMLAHILLQVLSTLISDENFMNKSYPKVVLHFKCCLAFCWID
jgi:hypothetical protein